jgi:hypothetical protein
MVVLPRPPSLRNFRTMLSRHIIMCHNNLILCVGCLHSEYARCSPTVSGVPKLPPESAATSTTVKSTDEVPCKKARSVTSLFGHYKNSNSGQDTDSQRREKILTQYLEHINADTFIAGETVFTSEAYAELWPLFSRVFAVPASSAPVERVFSQSGLILRPHRAKMSDSLLESLVFLKCNSSL